MALDFMSPSTRATGSDLTIAISPLGLIELSDEEFEVHGPRLTRYAQNAAFYLGHHWAFRRPPGEPQITANYVATFSDWMTNFCFGKGIEFQVDPMYQHITPALLDRIWSQDNKKGSTLWAIGNSGSVYGDSFTKIAYEPPWQDVLGNWQPGKVKIIPVNPSFCFPEWHPHDKDRLLRFKLKYRFWTTAPEGTRIVCTYVEILTDEYIEEYINDELIDRRPNPLGFIPVVHLANKPVMASPWGLSDIQYLIDLNRRFNEVATAIQDIINYHVSPVTVVTGASINGLEKGANKVWAIRDKDVKVSNLEGGWEGLPHALEFMDRIKTWMHELAGIPEHALGESQPVSNTSGVALAIMFLPTMMQYTLKKVQYGEGFTEISAMALKCLFTHEPWTVQYDPTTDGIMKPELGQKPYVMPADPQLYNIDVVWEPPLPIDTLIKLQEIQLKLGLSLESRRGALRDLGEQFPDEKMQELFDEQLQDDKMSAARQVVMAHIQAVTMALTGIVPPGVETQDQKPTKEGETAPPVPPAQQNLPALPALDLSEALSGGGDQYFQDLLTQAYGTKLPSRRISDVNENTSNAEG